MTDPVRVARGLVPVLAAGGIVVALQQTLVIPLLPALPGLLDVSVDDASWTVTTTLLAAAVATPVVGRLADMLGKRRLLLVCLGMLVVGSVVAALSTSLAGLLVGRALQGFATGVIPLGISLMRDHLPPARLPSAIAQMSASLGVGGALGLPVAALVAQWADWRVIFWLSAALGVLVGALVLRLVPESEVVSRGRFDLGGAVGLSVGLVCFLLPLSKGGAWGWSSPLVLGLFAASVVSFALWVLWELRSPHPLVDLRVAVGRQVLLTNVASLVFGFALLTSALVFPQLLQLPSETGHGFGQSMLVAGLLLAPGGLVMMVMAPVSARITNASGPRTTLMLGALVVAVGYGVSALVHDQVWQLLVAIVVVSSGVGLAYAAIPALILAVVPASQTAAANSFNNVVRAIGTSSASAVAGLLLSQVTTTVGGQTYPSAGAFTAMLAIASGSALAALVVAAFLPRVQVREVEARVEAGVEAGVGGEVDEVGDRAPGRH